MKPMYAPFDNEWLKIGNSEKSNRRMSACSSSTSARSKKPTCLKQEIDKNVWVLKATPKVLENIYQGKDMEFRDATGKALVDQ